jgi:hypothetical protein
MPKMSNDWAKPEINEGRRNQKRNNMKSEDVFIRPQPNVPIQGRMIGPYMEFIAHWPRLDKGERDEKGKIVWANVAFPDAKDRNYKPTRICTDDTPADVRAKDLDAYLSTTKCPWCRLKFQGYHGSIRYAINIVNRGDNTCRVLELPPTAFAKLWELREKYLKLMPKGLNDIKGRVFDLTFKINDLKNQWTVEPVINMEDAEATIADSLLSLTDEDIEILKKINPDAKNEEDYLRGHDLETWYRKDYMSKEWQEKLASKLGLKSGEILELSPYERNQQSKTAAVEGFEDEVDDAVAETVAEEPEVVEQDSVNTEDEWGSLDETPAAKPAVKTKAEEKTEEKPEAEEDDWTF